MTREEESDFFALRGEGVWYMAEETFPQVLRSSVFVTSYSYFEDKLEAVCEGCQRRMTLKLSASDLAGKGVIRSYEYLRKVVCLPVAEILTNWSAVVALNRMRNVIVHMGGKLTDNGASRSAREFAKAHPQLANVNEYGYLRLSAEFCPFVIDTFRECLQKLTKAAD